MPFQNTQKGIIQTQQLISKNRFRHTNVEEKPDIPEETQECRELDSGASSISILISFGCRLIQEKQLISLSTTTTNASTHTKY